VNDAGGGEGVVSDVVIKNIAPMTDSS